MPTLNTPDWKEKKGRTEDGVANLKMKFVSWPNIDVANRSKGHSKKSVKSSKNTSVTNVKGPTSNASIPTNTSASTSKK
jgi:hypothetical protein